VSYALIRQAILDRCSLTATYDGSVRHFCPHAIGSDTKGESNVMAFQYAGGSSKGAQALSGLARAFMYAGARALLVSHWSVDSAAAVTLVTSAVGSITRDPGTGRAEALRQAMQAMLANLSTPERAHPAYWAPFIVVGEGAAGR
jgi:hypothetical protein